MVRLTSRSPEERRGYQEEQEEKRRKLRMDRERRPKKRNGSRERPLLAENQLESKTRCDICGYDQPDVMVFEDRGTRTRFGAVRANVCMGCQAQILNIRLDDGNYRYGLIGSVDEINAPIISGGEVARKKLF